MNKVGKASLLIALLLMFSAAAYADNFAVVTDTTWSYLGYNATTSTGPFAGGGTPAVALSGVTPVWANPIPGSQWIANDLTGPGGIHPANGYYKYSQTFTVNALMPYHIDIGSFADDTAQIWINNTMVVDFALLGGNTHCATGGSGPTCLGSPWMVHLGSFVLDPGSNLISVIDAQTGGNSAGIDLAIVGSAVPEPGSLLLMGIGLLGLAAVIFRRFKAGAPIALHM